MTLFAKSFEELTNKQLYEIIKSRSEIFLLEQNIVCQDLDDVDYLARHCFYEKDGRVIAYLRAYYEGEGTVKIGRVLTLEHGKGIGSSLMKASIADIKKTMPCDKIVVNAQKQAEGFYSFLGFVTVSDEFLEEGVVHVRMELKVKK